MKPLEIMGQRFSSLLVIKRVGNSEGKRTQWLCQCDCGNEKIILGGDLNNGKVKSCGCLRHPKGENNSCYKQIKVKCPICNKERAICPSQIPYIKTCGSKECSSKLRSIKMTGENNHRWLKGSVGYDAATIYLQGIEEIRRDPNDNRILQVRCIYCNKWFRPTARQVAQRKRVILGQKGGTGDNRFYCSDGCKQACPIYRKIRHPAGFRKGSARETDAPLRKMVLERDDWQCQICGSNENLHCHHIESYTQNKMTSADMDNCITLCKTHHKWVHSKEGCKYFELRCQQKAAA